jgi:DnaK suppressor protein
MSKRQGLDSRFVQQENEGQSGDGRRRRVDHSERRGMAIATNEGPKFLSPSEGRGVRGIDRVGMTSARPAFLKSGSLGGEGGMSREELMLKAGPKAQLLPCAFIAGDSSVRQDALRHLFHERRRLLEMTCAAREGSPDLLEVAQETEEERVWLAVLDRSYAARLELDRAIELLAEGRYGRCADCDRRIPSGRLRVLPFAVRCVVCQGRHELPHARGAFESRDRDARLAVWEDGDAA